VLLGLENYLVSGNLAYKHVHTAVAATVSSKLRAISDNQMTRRVTPDNSGLISHNVVAICAPCNICRVFLNYISLLVQNWIVFFFTSD